MYPEHFWFPSVTWSTQLCRLGGAGPVAVREVRAAHRAEPQGSGVPGGCWYHLLLTPLVLKQRCSRLRRLVWFFATTANISTDRAASNITVFLSSNWTCRRLRGDHDLLAQPWGREERGAEGLCQQPQPFCSADLQLRGCSALLALFRPDPFPGR